MNLKNFPKRLDSKTSCLRIVVPENLDLALEGLIRKVLREQPKTDDIYSFAADYFETLLKIRDKAGGKFTAAQLCPFHNDEDAHEMIKLAGTFAKPGLAKPFKRNDELAKIRKPEQKKQQAKTQIKGEQKRQKPMEKDKKTVEQKQVTPDLIKKLPTVAQPEVEGITETKDTKGGEAKLEKDENEEEFLASDPIKELVEKELMMEASKNKTDGNEKTETDKENTQQEEKPVESVKNDVKVGEEKESQKEGGGNKRNEKAETEQKTEEIIPKEVNKVTEEESKNAEPIKEMTENLKTENEESVIEKNKETVTEKDEKSTERKNGESIKNKNKESVSEKDEEVDKETKPDTITAESKEGDTKIEEMQEGKERTNEAEKISEKVAESLVTEARPEDKKDETNRNLTHKEINKKDDTFPVTEAIRKVTDALPTEKLPEISEDVPEKEKDVTQTNGNSNTDVQQAVKSTETPTETSSGEIKPQTTEEKESTDDQHPIEAHEEAKQTETPTETSSVEIKPQETETKQIKDDQHPAQVEQTETPAEISPKEAKPEEKETKQDQQLTDNIQPVQEISTTIPENKSEAHPADTTATDKADTNKETEKPEESKLDNTTSQPATENIQTIAENTEKEAETKETEPLEDKNTSVNVSPAEQPKDAVTEKTEEPKHQQSITVNEEKTFGEIIKNDEQITTEEIKPADAKADDGTKATETTTEAETPAAATKTEGTDNAAEPENIKTTTEVSEKPAEEEPTQTEESKKPETSSIAEPKIEEDKCQPEGKVEAKEPEKQSLNEDNKMADETQIEDNQTVSKEELKATSGGTPKQAEESTNKEETGDELCSVVDIEHIPKDKIAMEKQESEPQPDKPTAELQTQTGEAKTGELSEESSRVPTVETETKEPEVEPRETETEKVETEEELCTVVDVQQIPKEEKVDEDKLREDENTEAKDSAEAEELCTVVDIEHIPKEDKMEDKSREEKVENIESKDNTEAEELCTVVDIQQIPNEEKTDEDKSREDRVENIETKDDKTEAEELCTVVDTDNIPKEDAEEIQVESIQTTAEKQTTEVRAELREEPSGLPAEQKDSEKPNDAPEHAKGNKTEPTEVNNMDTQHIIKVEEVENPTKPDEIQIKTIQTHYYDTLQVPETVTKEYRVHNVVPTASGLLGVPSFLHQTPNTGLIVDENMNSSPAEELLESLPISPPAEESTENLPTEITKPETAESSKPETTETTQTATPEQAELRKTDLTSLPVNQHDMEVETPKTASDDLLDLMTPTSGYSLNLSELSLLTASELFLDSEKRYSSLEKEEVRYTTPKMEDTADQKQEVEEVIEKTVLPSRIEAVPVPPREAEEINQESNLQLAETVKEKKEDEPEKEKKEDEPEKEKKEEKPENDSSDASSNGRSVDSDVPFISVDVRTVIETQVLDDEEEKNGERPEVEVTVQATIDVQDEVEMSQPKANSVDAEKGMSDSKAQEKQGVTPSLELQSRRLQDEERKESTSTDHTTGMEGSSLESDLTTSSAATEIKRIDSSKRNSNSGRSLVSAQSLDLGKRNPLVKTRSLSTFRHGVTDFEVWNTIEKELEDAAIKIQSKFRGYKTRKKLQRENAVQITTEESSVSTTPVEAEAKDEGQQSTGEFHDSIILSEHPR